MRLSSATVACLSVVLAFLCQWTLVHTSFHANWTGLFCAGDQFNRPAEIQDHEYLFNGAAGYDGQFYQVIAHDPLLQRHSDRFIDAPRLRYRRILMPGLAFVLAGGRPGYIDWAYFAVGWFLIALGTFCLAELAVAAGRSPLWGLLFLITPATLAAIERMTVDISLTALLMATLLAARGQRWVLLWLACAGAMLAKETGVLVIFAVAIWLVRQHKFRLAAALGSSVLPAAAWYVFVQSHTRGDYSTSDFTFAALLTPLTQPLHPGVISLIFRVATIGAVIGLLWAAVRSIELAVRDRFHDLGLLLCFLFAALVLLFQNSAIWVEPNAFTRVYSPVMVCLIAATWRRNFTRTLITFTMVALPLSLQLGAGLMGR